MRLIDISTTLRTGIISDPPQMLPEIEYTSHAQGAQEMCAAFPGLTPDQLPNGEGWAVERVHITTHNGTHLDAPYHHASTMNKGERAITIDEVPLEWCYAPGIKLDFRHYEDGHVVTRQEMQAELARIDHTLSPLDIVLINTSAGDRYGEDDYVLKGCGIGREATLYLLEQGVRVTGTDAWSWDAPFPYTTQKFAKSKDASLIWEGHKASLEIGYCHMEKLGNLAALPSSGFTVSCFPVKIAAASAGWTRAVAILP